MSVSCGAGVSMDCEGGGGGSGTGFEIVTSDRTYYVRTDGNDNNTGLVNTAGGAFRTVQHAVDVVTQTLHMKECIVTIDGNGSTYAEAPYLSTVLGNGGEEYIVVLKNVVLVPTSTSDAVIYIDGSFGIWQLEDVTLDARNATVNACLYVAGSDVFVTGTVNMYAPPAWGNFPSAFVGLFYRSYTNIFSCDLHLFGTAAANVFYADNNTYFETIDLDVTVENALVCATAFTQALDNSIMNFGIGGGTTFTGSATGKRFIVDIGSVINTPSNAGGVNYFPGDVAGTCGLSAFYDGAQGIRQKAGAVVAGDLASGTSQVIQDTTNGRLALYYNVGGTLYFVGYIKTSNSDIVFPAGIIASSIVVPLNTMVATQFDKTNDSTLANVAGLSVSVVASGVYDFEAVLHLTADAIGGWKTAIGGTCTATAFIQQTEAISDTSNALAVSGRDTTKGNLQSAALDATYVVLIWGAITVNGAGTLTVQFAQKTATPATTSSVLVGSTFKVTRQS